MPALHIPTGTGPATLVPVTAVPHLHHIAPTIIEDIVILFDADASHTNRANTYLVAPGHTVTGDAWVVMRVRTPTGTTFTQLPAWTHGPLRQLLG